MNFCLTRGAGPDAGAADAAARRACAATFSRARPVPMHPQQCQRGLAPGCDRGWGAQRRRTRLAVIVMVVLPVAAERAARAAAMAARPLSASARGRKRVRVRALNDWAYLAFFLTVLCI